SGRGIDENNQIRYDRVLNLTEQTTHKEMQ
ncbi:MAG: hypothetical protein ACI9OU_001333, partial [Candidatus Promineifilaceae bacterium]